MSTIDILDKIIDAVVDINITMDRESVPTDKALIKEGLLDSMGFVELLSFIEEEFNIEVNDEEMIEANFGTLAKTAEFVQKKIEA